MNNLLIGTTLKSHSALFYVYMEPMDIRNIGHMEQFGQVPKCRFSYVNVNKLRKNFADDIKKQDILTRIATSVDTVHSND